MKREERIQQILKVAKAKKLNMSTLVFLLAMTPDKKLTGIYHQVRDIFENEVIKFSKLILLPDEYEERTFIIPDSEYRVKKDKRKGYKGWVILAGIWQTKSSTFGASLSFSPNLFKNLKQYIK